jgi:hypothetical protein
MKVQCRHRAVVALLTLGSLSACTSDKGNSTGSEAGAYVCGSAWWGALPGYDRPSLSIRACMNERICAGEHVLTTERGAHEYLENEAVYFAAAYYPSGSGNYIGDEENNLDVHFEFLPAVAATLSDSDRATLTIWADDGSMMIDSTSEGPYRSGMSSGGETCKGISLHLDGSERQE